MKIKCTTIEEREAAKRRQRLRDDDYYDEHVDKANDEARMDFDFDSRDSEGHGEDPDNEDVSK